MSHKHLVSLMRSAALCAAVAGCGGGGGGGPQNQNQLPTAQFSSSVASGPAPLTVTFDASASTDPDGSIASFKWDLDGDGVLETTSPGATVSQTYTTAGTVNVALRVTDNQGGKDDVVQPITVTAAVSAAIIDPVAGQGAAAVAIVDGRPAVAYTDENGNVVYARALDAAGSAWGPRVPVLHVQVKDLSLAVVDGRPAIGCIENALAGVLRYQGALDADGTAWDAAVQVLSGTAVSHAGRLVVSDGRPAFVVSKGGAGSQNRVAFVRADDADGAAWPAAAVDITPLDIGSDPDIVILADGHPAVAFIEGTKVDFVRASDVDGALWPSAFVVAGTFTHGKDGGPVLGLLSGKPAIVLDGNGNLEYMHSHKADGSSWELLQTLLTNADFGINLPLPATIGNSPVLAFTNGKADAIQLLTATDASADAFAAPATVLGVNAGSLAVLDLGGKAGFAYRDRADDKLKFVVAP